MNTTNTTNTQPVPLIEVQAVSKYFGSVIALKDISMKVNAGEVMCLLGDNGAGKSTLIKILSGVYRPSDGHYMVEGKEARFSSPREALSAGIATVFQDLAMIPLMGISRNFFLGSEPTQGWGPFSRYNAKFADSVTREELARIGIQERRSHRQLRHRQNIPQLPETTGEIRCPHVIDRIDENHPRGFVRADGACAIQRFCLTLPHKHNLISFFPNLSVQRPESVIFQIWPPATLGDYDQI